MRLCILAGAFCLPIATAVHAQCLPSGEFLIDTARLSAPGAAWEPAVGFDGTEFLVVWLDERTGDCALFAARVSPAGEVIDPNGIMVAQDAENWRPAVAFDGTNYLVVYGENGHIRARRVSPEGTVLEPEIEVSNAGQSQENADVAFDGTNYLVVWEDYRVDNNDIYCARVSPAGVVLDTAGIPVADSLYGETMPDVCARPGGFLVVWQTEYEQRNIRAARVTSAGQVLDPNGLVLAPNAAEQVIPRSPLTEPMPWQSGRTTEPARLISTVRG